MAKKYNKKKLFISSSYFRNYIIFIINKQY